MDQKIQPEVRRYIEILLQDAGVNTSTQKEPIYYEEMIQDVFNQLDTFATSVMINKLTENQENEFLRMRDENASADQIEKYLQEKIPDVKSVMENIFRDFKTWYLGTN